MGYFDEKIGTICNSVLKTMTIYLSIYARLMKHVEGRTINRHLMNIYSNQTCSAPLHYDATVLNIEGDDNAITTSLLFSFPFYNNNYQSIGVSTNGLITFGGTSSSYTNAIIPSSAPPNNYIAPFWTDLITTGKSIFMYQTESFAIIQWTNMGFYGTSVPLGTFQTVLHSNGTIELRYITLMGSSMSFGSSATVGIENMDGTRGILISFMQTNLASRKRYALYFDTEGNDYFYISSTDTSSIILLPETLPVVPTLHTPTDSSVYFIYSSVPFSWTSEKADYYKLFVAFDYTLSNIIYQNTEILTTTYTLYDLLSGTYYWKLYGCNSFGCTESCTLQFTISELSYPPPNPPEPPLPPPPSPPSPPPPSPPPPSPPPPSPPPPSPPPPPPPEPPSPPPPEPPSPPSPPPPPPEETILSQATIQQISAAVSTAVSTAVATSVSAVISSSVAGSVGGSVGGASSVPSPAGLVSMISTVQSMNMKMNLQIGGTPETIKGVAGGVGWVNLDVSLPSSEKRRKLLALQEDPYEKAKALFVYSFLMFLLPCSIIHWSIQYYLETKKKKHIQGIMLFPQIELTIALLLVNPYAKNAAKLFSLGTAKSVFAGIGMLLVIPIPILLFSVYAVRKLVIKERAVKFLMFHKVEHVHGILNFIKRGFFASSNTGYWKEEKHKVVDKYGVFFKSIRGPLYVFKDKMVRYDHKKRCYKWGTVLNIQDKFVHIRTYYKSYFILRNILIAILLNAFPYTIHGNITQSILLILLLTIHVYFMMFISPFNTAKDQFADIASNSCELGTYAAGFSILMARRLDWILLLPRLEQGMFVFQLMSIGIQIVTQLWNVVLIVALVKSIITDKYFKDQFVQKAYSELIVKKYANRWLYKVHRRTLKGWEFIYAEEKSISPKMVQLHL